MTRRHDHDRAPPVLWFSQTSESPPTGEPQFAVLMIVVALLALVFGAFAVLTRSGAEAGEPTVVAPAAPDQASRSTAMLAELPPLSLVVTQHDGAPPMRIEVDEGIRIDVNSLKGLGSFAVDASGAWLAALSFSSQVGRSQTLWIGPVNGELAPVAVDVRGYAWHDTRPGQIAFGALPTGADTRGVFKLDVLDARPRSVQASESTGWVRNWGDWGFIVRSSGTGPWFDILDPAGMTVLEHQQGLTVGVIPDVGLLVTSWGSDSQPRIVNLETGESAPMSSLGDAQYVWNLALGGLDGAIAIQATNFDNSKNEVLVIAADGSLVAEIPAAGGTAAMTWSNDGSTLFFMREDHRTQTDLVIYDAGTGIIDEIPFDQLHASDFWTRTIVVGTP